MSIEFELKYNATAAVQAAIEDAYPADYRVITMETTYFDTPEGGLSDRHITLRRRLENGVSVCTVKTPVGGLARGEWECRCEDIQEAIPQLCAMGAPDDLLSITAGGLAPICAARFTRRAGLVQWCGTTLEIALDSGVLIGGGKEIPMSEVECELKSGSPEAVMAFGAGLAEQFGLSVQKKSKFRRALALAKGE